jgi:hypothetical protein
MQRRRNPRRGRVRICSAKKFTLAQRRTTTGETLMTTWRIRDFHSADLDGILHLWLPEDVR